MNKTEREQVALTLREAASSLISAGELDRVLKQLADMNRDLINLLRWRNNIDPASSPDDYKDAEEEIEALRDKMDKIVKRLDSHRLRD